MSILNFRKLTPQVPSSCEFSSVATDEMASAATEDMTSSTATEADFLLLQQKRVSSVTTEEIFF